MKNPLCTRLACGLVFLLGSLASHAQQLVPPTQLGYWNLEINRTTRDYTIVRFYDDQDRLVFETRLDGLCLDLAQGSAQRRRRTAASLSLALQTVLLDPANANQTVAGLAQQFDSHGRPAQRYAGR